jgi:hypothetical protein
MGWVFLETDGTCSILAAAGAIEMLFTITDGVQYHVPRQWAIDLWFFHSKKNSMDICNPSKVFPWVTSNLFIIAYFTETLF